MEAKNKAIQLVEKFLQYVDCGDNRYSTKQQEENAKQCALICVEEILSLNTESFDEANNPHHYFSKKYWQQVKQEILNLKQ